MRWTCRWPVFHGFFCPDTAQPYCLWHVSVGCRATIGWRKIGGSSCLTRMEANVNRAVSPTLAYEYSLQRLTSTHDIMNIGGSQLAWRLLTVRFQLWTKTPPTIPERSIWCHGELWGVYCKDFGENRQHHNGVALYPVWNSLMIQCCCLHLTIWFVMCSHVHELCNLIFNGLIFHKSVEIFFLQL